MNQRNTSITIKEIGTYANPWLVIDFCIAVTGNSQISAIERGHVVRRCSNELASCNDPRWLQNHTGTASCRRFRDKGHEINDTELKNVAATSALEKFSSKLNLNKKYRN